MEIWHFICWVITLAPLTLVILISIFDGLCHFYTRGRYSPKILQRGDDCSYSDSFIHLLILSSIWIVFSVFVLVILESLYFKIGLQGMILSALIIGLIILPRYVMDLIHNLQFSFKDRDAKRITKLEQELEKLKRG